jgi:hypothetical protein
MQTDSLLKHTQRKLLLSELFNRLFKEVPGDSHILFFASEIKQLDPLLEQADPVLRALDRIEKELFGFHYSATDFMGRDEDVITVDCDPPERLEEYIAKLELELKSLDQEEKRHRFVLDEDGNLHVSGSNLAPYSVERGSIRHKVIFYLAKNKDWMSADALAKLIKTDAKRIRTTVGQIRKFVEKKFEVSGYDLIQSREDGGYRANTIILKTAKGYSP